MQYGITQSYLSTGRGSISHPYSGRYSIYPPIKDEQPSETEPTQINDFPEVTEEVPAIPGVSWLIQPSVPLGILS